MGRRDGEPERLRALVQGEFRHHEGTKDEIPATVEAAEKEIGSVELGDTGP
jgi:hypothetical protein